MDPAAWRKRAKLSLREMAQRLERGWSSIRRWENGECEAPNFVVLAYEKASDGAVSGGDFNRARRRYLRARRGRGGAATVRAA